MIEKTRKFLYTQKEFSIIEEYAALNANKKIILLDTLLNEGINQFQKRVKAIWPDVEEHEIQKLDQFLNLVRVASH